MSQKTIIDQHERKHNYLRISLTERCNLRCTYCMPEEGIAIRDRKEFMSHEETIAIAKEFVAMGVNKIRLTGGEPLIKKDISSLILELGKLPVELVITTNAVLVDRFIDTFKLAGIRSINVSLDSLKTQKINSISRRKYGDAIQKNIALLIEEGFNVKINVVLMKGFNDDEILDFIEMTRRKPVEVRFIEFMPFGGNKWEWEKKVSLKSILGKVNDHYTSSSVTECSSFPNDTARKYQIEGFEGKFGIISTLTQPFCSTCNRIRLTADGKIKNCLFSSEETDILTAFRNGQDIQSLITQSVYHKKKERAGISDFKEEAGKNVFSKNRSMITIGG